MPAGGACQEAVRLILKRTLNYHASSVGSFGMSLKFHFHPLASFCQKVLIALYENGTPFEPHVVDLSNEASTAAFKKLWPIAKMPVLRDDARDRTIPESSIIIEYLAQHYPGGTKLIPADG